MDTRPPHEGTQPLEAPAIGCRQQRPASDPPRWPPAGARLTPTGFVATQHLIKFVIIICNVYCITLTAHNVPGPNNELAGYGRVCWNPVQQKSIRGCKDPRP